MRKKLFLLFLIFIVLFTWFSYDVAKERWQKRDFDTTVKIQDRINPERSRRIDSVFSYFSLIGSAEVSVGFCFLLAVAYLIKRRWLAALGWLMVVPATVAEIFGKLFIFHPGPPVFFHRSLLPTGLPSFYVQTNFSYPSGHMTRTIFIAAVFICMLIFTARNSFSKLVILLSLAGLAFMMGLSRVYLGEHWLSDVIGGSLLGAASGFFASVLILRQKRFKINELPGGGEYK